MATSTRFAPEPPFVAHVYADDYLEIRKLVQQYPEIETGGDLFGLWQDDETVVIQLFIGPGKNCERTTTSFYQDIEYLHRVGSVITSEEGLCNVGEWHSHHQIGMPEPSAADRRTVFNNMPQLGLERFVLFIATIESTRSSGQRSRRPWEVELEQINLRCFLFLGSTHKMVNGEIQIIKGSNPHRIRNKASREIKDGAEIPPKDPYSSGKATKGNDKESAPQPSRNKKPDKKKPEETAQTATGKTLKQPAERYGARKPERQAQGVPPQPTVLRETKPQNIEEPKGTGTPHVSRETKPQNVEEKGTGTPRVSHETKSQATSPESRSEKPQDNQRHARRMQDHYADKDHSTEDKENQARGDNNKNQTKIVSASSFDRGTKGKVSPRNTPPQTAPTQAWGGGPQGNFQQSTYFTSSHGGLVQEGTGTQRNIQPYQPSSHMPQPPYYHQPTGQASAWGGKGSQGNMPRSSLFTDQAAQHSSRAAQAKPGSASVLVTKLSRGGFF